MPNLTRQAGIDAMNIIRSWTDEELIRELLCPLRPSIQETYPPLFAVALARILASKKKERK